jgi:indole-3-glycerol phosphate synthase
MASAKIIGVNNRDLKTMEVRIETSLELIEKIPENCVAVSESGIRNHQDVVKMRNAGFDAFLIGEHLMKAADPGAALFELLGQPRVTREQFDAASAATDAKNGVWQN